MRTNYSLFCERCGENYTTSVKFGKFCPPCRILHNREKTRQYYRDHTLQAKASIRRAYYKRVDYYKEKAKKLAKRRDKEIRQTVFYHYSGGFNACVCCGEKELDFLTIDHINGGGNKHRAEIGMSRTGGTNFYWWLIKNGLPLGFQVLCSNCNLSKGKHGICVHQRGLSQIAE